MLVTRSGSFNVVFKNTTSVAQNVCNPSITTISTLSSLLPWVAAQSWSLCFRSASCCCFASKDWIPHLGSASRCKCSAQHWNASSLCPTDCFSQRSLCALSSLNRAAGVGRCWKSSHRGNRRRGRRRCRARQRSPWTRPCKLYCSCAASTHQHWALQKQVTNINTDITTKNESSQTDVPMNRTLARFAKGKCFWPEHFSECLPTINRDDLFTRFFLLWRKNVQ